MSKWELKMYCRNIWKRVFFTNCQEELFEFFLTFSYLYFFRTILNFLRTWNGGANFSGVAAMKSFFNNPNHPFFHLKLLLLVLLQVLLSSAGPNLFIPQPMLTHSLSQPRSGPLCPPGTWRLRSPANTTFSAPHLLPMSQSLAQGRGIRIGKEGEAWI